MYFSGDGPVTNLADIWASGLVIWEMIALSTPHLETDEKDTSSFADSFTETGMQDTKKHRRYDESLNNSILLLEEINRAKYGKYFYNGIFKS